MQTSKARNCCNSETPQKVSPRALSSEVSPKISPRNASSEVPQKHSPRVVRQLKITSQDSGSSSSSHTSRTPKDRSTKLGERKLPRSPVSEAKKKGPNKVAELEAQISQLQNDLKKVNEQLDSSEAQRNKALKDAEESNKQLLAMSSSLEETQQQALKQSNTEEPIVSEDHVPQALNQPNSYSEEAINSENHLQQALKQSNTEEPIVSEDHVPQALNQPKSYSEEAIDSENHVQQALQQSNTVEPAVSEDHVAEALKQSNSKDIIVFEEHVQQDLKQPITEEAIVSEDHVPQDWKQPDSKGDNVVDDHVSLVNSELENLKKQQSVDSALLDLAVNEIKELKLQLEVVAESEVTQTKQAEVAQSELNDLKESLADALVLVENMDNQLKDSKESEAQAKELVEETLFQLQAAKKTVESLRSDGTKTVDAYEVIATELEQSRARVNSLDALVHELKSVTENARGDESQSEGMKSEELGHLIEAEVTSLKYKVNQLRSALEASEIKCLEEKTQSELQLKMAFEKLEEIKSFSLAREAELKSEVEQARIQIEELKANLIDKETELQGICEENEGLNLKLDNMSPCKGEFNYEKDIIQKVDNLKATLLDKETQLQNIMEENETLKLEIKKKDTDNSEADAAKAAEREALMKLGYVMEEVDKSNRRITRVSEQLEAAQATNSEMEAELRRLKVQSDQWRKAAEAAAAMLSTGNNGKFMDRAVSMDTKYSTRSRGIGSLYSEDIDEEDMNRKKNPNVLKKLGVLWKKPQK